MVELDGEGGMAVGGLAGARVPTGGLPPGGSPPCRVALTGGLSFSAVCAGNTDIRIVGSLLILDLFYNLLKQS